MEQDTQFRRFNRGFYQRLFTNLLTNLQPKIVNKYGVFCFELLHIFCPFTKMILNRNSFCPILVNLVPNSRRGYKIWMIIFPPE